MSVRRVLQSMAGAGIAAWLVGENVAAEPSGSSSASYSLTSSVLDAGGGRTAIPARFTFDTSVGSLGGAARSADHRVTIWFGFPAQISVMHGLVANPDVVARLPRGLFKISPDQLVVNDAGEISGELRVIGVQPVLSGAAGPATVGAVRLEEGWIIYEPPDGFAGEDRFAYTIVDVEGVLAAAEVTVTVAPPDLRPTKNVLAIAPLPDVSHMRIRFVGIPGRTYRVEAALDLSAPEWVVVGTGTANAFGIYEFIDTDAGEFETRYYRALQP